MIIKILILDFSVDNFEATLASVKEAGNPIVTEAHKNRIQGYSNCIRPGSEQGRFVQELLTMSTSSPGK